MSSNKPHKNSPNPIPGAIPKPQALGPYVKPQPPAPVPYNLTPAGITADSTRAAKVAQAEAPYKKDPNAGPSDHFVFPTGTDPNGKPIVLRGNTVTGDLEPTDQAAKPAGAGGGGGSLSPEDRQKMMTQAKLDNATMKAYEEKVIAAKKAPGTVAGLAGAAAASGGTGFGAQALGILGNQATGAIDPDYQRYITAQRSYGRIMGNLQSKRYTDHQAEIERSISGLQGNDLEGTIRYKTAAPGRLTR